MGSKVQSLMREFFTSNEFLLFVFSSSGPKKKNPMFSSVMTETLQEGERAQLIKDNCTMLRNTDNTSYRSHCNFLLGVNKIQVKFLPGTSNENNCINHSSDSSDFSKLKKKKKKKRTTPEWSAEILNSTRNQEEINPLQSLKGPD